MFKYPGHGRTAMAFVERINLEKPRLNELPEGHTAVDMHLHTNYSDSYTTIKMLLKAAKRKGIGVAVTDHNNVRGAVEASKAKTDVMVIPGMELTTQERAHFLLYFYSWKDAQHYYKDHIEKKKSANPYIFTNVPVEEAIDSLKGYNGIIGAAHPYQLPVMGVCKSIARGWIKEDIFERLDFIEALSGSHTEKQNLMSAKLALERGMSFTGGSDAHVVRNIGKIVTHAKADSVEGFLDSIKKKKNYVVGKALSNVGKLPQISACVSGHMRYLQPTLKAKTKRAMVEGFQYHVPRIKEKIEETQQLTRARITEISDNSKEKLTTFRKRSVKTIRRIVKTKRA